jgi:murein DD-endopeptidase MepM/ murein hydrolase activator NlpD
LPKTPEGARRHIDRLRLDRLSPSSVTRVGRLAADAAAAARTMIRARVGATRLGTSRKSLRATLVAAARPLTTAERALPIAVAAIVAIASLLAVLPNSPQGAVSGAQGQLGGVRIAIGGGTDTSGAGVAAANVPSKAVTDQGSFQPLTLPADAAGTTATQGGTLLDDGTLLTGYAPQTSVEDGSNLIRTYTVQAGDVLSTISDKFGVSMMTLWWANNLTSKDSLHIGQVLRIPTVNGLIVTVAASDTLDSLAAKYGVDAQQIVTVNGLTDSTLVVGQVLIVPGAQGAPIPTPTPAPKPKATSGGSSGAGLSGNYTGGRLAWPVIGGNNYISQYYHYGHLAIDIAAAYGTPIVAAAAGQVIWAGWKSNGGGYQVWISHGGNLYTAYYHMSAVLVSGGQTVGRGQQIGRIGQSGWATGPHCHFEVWIGPIWGGGTPMNPLNYL